MRLVLPTSPTRRGQPLAAVMALAVHAGVVSLLLGPATPVIPGPVGPGIAVPLPVLSPSSSTAGGRGSNIGGPAPAPLPPAPVPWRPGGGPPPLAPLPAPNVGGGRATGVSPFGQTGSSLPVVSWDSMEGGDFQVVPPQLLDSLVVDYPDRRLEGAVEVEYVIETTGRMDPASFHVRGSPDPQLVRAVRSALLGARFRPGRVQDRPARMLVRQRFRFERR